MNNANWSIDENMRAKSRTCANFYHEKLINFSANDAGIVCAEFMYPAGTDKEVNINEITINLYLLVK